MSSTAGALAQRRAADGNSPVLRQIALIAAYTALSLFVALAVLLLIRRVSGAFHLPMSASAFVLAAILLEIVAFLLRRRFHESPLQSSVLGIRYLVLSAKHTRLLGKDDIELRLSAIDVLTTFSVLAIALSLSIRGTPLWGLFIAWLTIIATEIAQRLPRFRVPRSSLLPLSTLQTQPAASVACDNGKADPEIPSGLIQQLTRVLEDGCESIHVLLKADIPANDRVAVVHMAFCPPLADRPELSAHALDSYDALAKPKKETP